MKPLIIIPARMASTRLFGKPLADIHGKPMIIHVVERAIAAHLGPVFVATDHQDIADAVEKHGFNAVLTREHHHSGSDRIYEALMKIDPKSQYDVIVNVQGDLPSLPGKNIVAALAPLQNAETDITTLGAVITKDSEKPNPNVVKIIGSPIGENRLRALYFTRAQAPYGPGPLYHHIGLYCYRRRALEKFIKLPPSALEMREKLEQLRALENNLRIDVEIIQTVPLGVDTAEDLDYARQLLAPSR